MNLLGLFSLILSLWARMQPEGKTIYLAPNGKDTHPGTQEQPLASLTGARDLIRKLQTSDTLYVKIAPGDYFLNGPLELTSMDVTPIVFEGMGEEVTFYGGVPVTHWEKVSDQLCRSPVPSLCQGHFPFEQLYVNGKRAIRARMPNKGFFEVKKVEETILDLGKGRLPEFAIQKVRLNPDDVALLKNESSEAIKNALITFYHKWEVTSKYIDHFFLVRWA